MTPEASRIIERIISTQRNIKVYGGITVGMILSIYFFTFAMLLDKAPPIFITIQAITAVIFVGLFFVGNQVSFIATRLILWGSAYRQAFAQLSPHDVVRDIEETKSLFDQRRAQADGSR